MNAAAFGARAMDKDLDGLECDERATKINSQKESCTL